MDITLFPVVVDSTVFQEKVCPFCLQAFDPALVSDPICCCDCYSTWLEVKEYCQNFHGLVGIARMITEASKA